MSEYQYYEFRAIDRELTQREMDALGDLSSRAEITPTSFTNEYHYANFRGSPLKLMDKYFDAFVYVANWGTRRLMLRLPRGLIDVGQFKPYCSGECLTLTARKNHVILEFVSDDEEFGGWEEGTAWMDELVVLRAELLAGDLRSLFIAWLLALQLGRFDETDFVPDVPPRLDKPTAAQKVLMDFLRLGSQTLKAAARWSRQESPLPTTKKDYAAWIAKVPESKKNKYLLRLLDGDDKQLKTELMTQFRRTSGKPKAPPPASAPRRTVGELMTLVHG